MSDVTGVPAATADDTSTPRPKSKKELRAEKKAAKKAAAAASTTNNEESPTKIPKAESKEEKYRLKKERRKQQLKEREKEMLREKKVIRIKATECSLEAI